MEFVGRVVGAGEERVGEGRGAVGHGSGSQPTVARAEEGLGKPWVFEEREKGGEGEKKGIDTHMWGPCVS